MKEAHSEISHNYGEYFRVLSIVMLRNIYLNVLKFFQNIDCLKKVTNCATVEASSIWNKLIYTLAVQDTFYSHKLVVIKIMYIHIPKKWQDLTKKGYRSIIYFENNCPRFWCHSISFREAVRKIYQCHLPFTAFYCYPAG